MNPTPIQYFFAKDWPLKIYCAASGILGIAMAISWCQPSQEMFGDWAYCAFFIVSLLVAPVFFALCSMPVSFIVLVPLYYLGDRLAGAPFQIGDKFRILIGPHRNRVVEIYEVWNSRRQIRVKLDADSEKKVRDVFLFTQVCRESA